MLCIPNSQEELVLSSLLDTSILKDNGEQRYENSEMDCEETDSGQNNIKDLHPQEEML